MATFDVVIDPDSPVPAHYQAYEALKDGLGAWTPGAKLPTERVLATELGLSRATLRLALERLENDGLVLRRQGAGTYVAERRVEHDTRFLRGFSHEFAARGSRVKSKLLSMRTTGAPSGLRETLGVDRSTNAVIEVRRVRSLDGQPVSLETVWLPRERTAGLLDVDLNDRSLYAVLAELGIVPVSGQERLTAISLDEYEASQLEQRPGAAAMLVERVARDAEGGCVECVKTVLRADRFAFTTRLDLQSDGPDP